MKFFNLLKKELKEMFNQNMIVSLIVSFCLLMAIGQIMNSSIDSVEEKNVSITVYDEDSTEFTSKIMQSLEDYGYKINLVPSTNGIPNTDTELSNLSSNGSIMVIPKGFTQSIESGTTATIKNIGTVKGNSIMSQIQSGISSEAITDISNIIKSLIIEEKSSLNSEQIQFLDNPVTLDEFTIVGDKSENVSSSSLSAFISSQGTFIPIIIFVIIIMASQMIVTAIATEKIDKTLETLLSTPTSRISILSAKMISAGIVSLVSAGVYMLGFGFMMSPVTTSSISTTDMTNTITSTLTASQALANLGLTISPIEYAFIGIQIFLSIMIGLSISMILGALVTDIKSTQIVIMPVMFMALIPYLVSMLVDIDTLSPIAKILINIIPFTHTFNATNNIMFGEVSQFWFGVIYQVIFLIVCMFFAVNLFKSDKILTASLNFTKKKKRA